MGRSVQAALESSFQTVEHPDTLAISFAERVECSLTDVLFEHCYTKVMNGFKSLTTRSIHTFDFVTQVPIAVFLR